MHRLSLEEEKNILTDESNINNIINYKKLIPSFYYKNSTEERIFNNLCESSRSIEEQYLDDFLKLNNQRRAFFEIDSDNILNNNKALNEYSNYLNIAHDKISLLQATEEFRYKFDLFTELWKVENFIDNTITINNNKYKLFKFLMKHNILSKEQVDKINSIKTKKDKYYLCISRNPIDYLFCSTNQPFTSCEDLNSDYEGAYYMALGSLIVDPNRFIIFITKGRYKTYTIKRLEFKHLSYIQRSWGLISNESTISIIRSYPEEKLDLKYILEKLSYNICNTYFESKFSFELPLYEDNSFSMIYLDRIGSYYDGNSKIAYTSEGDTGPPDGEFCYTDGFENIDCFDDLYNGRDAICDYCEEHSSYLHTYEFRNNILYNLCECCSDRLVSCSHCNTLGMEDSFNHFDIPNIEYAETNEGEIPLCNSCLETLPTCSDCNSFIINDEYEVYNGEPYCMDCLNNYKHCYECGEIIINNEYEKDDGEIYCMDCYNELEKEEKIANE